VGGVLGVVVWVGVCVGFFVCFFFFFFWGFWGCVFGVGPPGVGFWFFCFVCGGLVCFLVFFVCFFVGVGWGGLLILFLFFFFFFFFFFSFFFLFFFFFFVFFPRATYSTRCPFANPVPTPVVWNFFFYILCYAGALGSFFFFF